MKKQTNVILLFADDQRFNTIHALGNDEIITPNLDKLVSNGTTFTHAHIPCGTSGAVCMPSRAMLHTGRTLFSLGNEGQTISDDFTLMGEVFQKNGYECFGTGKWHNGSDSYARSFTCGDNIFFGGMHDHWCVPVHSFDPTGKYDKTLRKTDDFMFSNKVLEFTADKINAGEHSTEFLTDGLLKFLDEDHDKPFFAYTAFLAPHDPRTMPDEFKNMYNPDNIKLPENFQAYHHIEYNNTNCRDEVLAPYPRTIEDTKKQIAEYYAMITHLDHQLGRIMDKLEKKGLLENTIVIYAADNGLAVGQHGLFGKQSLYEHSVRVPMIFSGKNIKAGEKTDALVYISDIFPTICDLLSFDTPVSVNCKSFAKVLDNSSNKSREHLYFAYVDKIRGVKKDNYKYVQHRHAGIKTHSLFDLVKDPYEMANLYAQTEFAQITTELVNLLEEEAKKSGEMDTPHGKNYWNMT